MDRAIRNTTAAGLMALLCLATSCVLADGIEASFSGYGTAGGTFTSNGRYSYIHNSTEYNGASSSLDVGLESRIGVQAVVTFDSHWSVTAQEEAKLRGTRNFDPGTEWLFVQYQPYSDLKVRVGRVVMPSFLYSDVINVGYAMPWFRAPNEIYASQPFDYLDGVQIQWQHSFGPVRVGAEASYGDAAATFNLSGLKLAADSKNTVNGAVWLSWRDLTVRYAQTDLRTNVNFPLTPQVQINTTLSDYFHCYGLQYDNGKALLMSEWIKRNEDNLAPFNHPVGVERGWYVAAGWRFGKFTPLVTYSTLDLLDSLLTPPESYNSWGASLRYDVARNLDLKVQVNRAAADNGLYWSTPQHTQDHIYVYSLGADFVF